MLRRVLSLLLMVGMIAALTTSPSQAVSDGNIACSGGGYFTISNNVVISKNGATGPQIDCIGTAVIPYGVTRIGNDGFYDQQGMTSIVIPDSVLSIGSNGVAGTGLTRVIIPDGVTTLSLIHI